VGLAVLPEEARARVRARGLRERARAALGEGEARCALLEEDGSCAIYAQRPLVCRSQGQALRYPEGFVPEASVRMRIQGGAVTWCPLNYTDTAPRSEDVLDAERVDQILAVVTRRHVARAEEALDRVALSDLAAQG
jgi:Fe-S-cluster containining protein